MRRCLWLIVAMLLLAPLASATILNVATTDRQSTVLTTPFYEDTYNFLLAGTLFTPTNPVYRANVALNFDFGPVAANTLVHSFTGWNVSDVQVAIGGFGQKDFVGSSYQLDQFSVNGSPFYSPLGYYGGSVLGLPFYYTVVHALQYGENMTAQVPVSTSGAVVYDWSPSSQIASSDPACPLAAESGCGYQTTTISNLTGLFYILSTESAHAFEHNNETATDQAFFAVSYTYRYWLANVSHPSAWSVSTAYTDRGANGLNIAYEFDTQANYISDAAHEEVDACKGFGQILQSIIGVCPSLTGMAQWAIALIPNILAFFLDFINPSAGDALRYVGDLAGQFVASYVFVLILIVQSPAKLFFVVLLTGSGMALMSGALRGDMATIWRMHGTFFKVLLIGAFWYFYIYYLLIRWIFALIVKIIDVIGNFIPFT